MIIASKNEKIVINIENETLPGVKRIAGKVAQDIKLVTGENIQVELLGQQSSKSPRVVAATLGHSAYLDSLIAQGRFDEASIKGKWEVYAFIIIPATDSEPETLLIAGSDKRGTIYGLFHLSEIAGVSPWVWFADVTPVHKDVISVSEADCFVSKVPSVKYRGFFINDEWPAYGNWTFEHFGGFTAEMYEHVFELLLRLKGNYLWPAMWTSNFSCDGPGMANAELADEMGVVMSNSHHEPCLRHSEEWDLVKGDDTPYGTAWNFDKNREGLTNYWRDGLKRNGHLENIITMGMRGERDSEIMANATLKDNIDYLKDVITFQNDLIKETISEDLDSTQRMLAIYKEVENYFHGDATTEGLKSWDGLDGITCMLCEDNFGNLRTLPEEGQRDRKGGWGMYYHFDYHGDPVSYEWINSTHISRTCEQMSQAYDFGIREIWIVNVGDLKPQEFPLSYFLDLAYDIDKWGQNNPKAVTEYLEKWVTTQFPGQSEVAKDIEKLIEGYTRINYIRKPEALGTNTYAVNAYGEAKAMLKKACELEALADKVWAKVKDSDQANAIFQLVYYPVMAAMNLLKLQLSAGKNNLLAKQGAMGANAIADKMGEYVQRDRELMKQYHCLNGGKWNGMMLSEHIGFANWNDEECAYPIQMRVTPANKPRIIVTAANGDVSTMGGDWTRKKLAIYDMLSGAARETFLTVRNGGAAPVACKISTGADWLIADSEAINVIDEMVVKLTIDEAKLNNAIAGDKNYAKATVVVKEEHTHVDIDVYACAADEAADKKVTILPTELLEEAKRQGRGNVVNELGCVIEMSAAQLGSDSKDAEYRILDSFGKYGLGLKAFPTTSYFEAGKNAPYADFSFEAEPGEYEITLVTAPSNPVVKYNPMAVGISLNGGAIMKVATVPEGFEGGDRTCPMWGQGVLNQEHTTEFSISAQKGTNTMRIYAMDPGTVLERILIRQAGTKWSAGYLGKLPKWVTE